MITLRSAVLAAWAAAVFIIAISPKTRDIMTIRAITIVLMPMTISYASALRYLMGSTLDTVCAIAACLMVGLVGVYVWQNGEIQSDQLAMAWVPLFQLALVSIFTLVFLKLNGRYPKTVLFDSESGRLPDRIFYISLCSLLVLVPMFLTRPS